MVWGWNTPFYYTGNSTGKINCWCAAWGTPAYSWFNYWVSNNQPHNPCIVLGSGLTTYTDYSGSEGIYQNINIENSAYHLSFRYKRHISTMQMVRYYMLK